jgi:hypothetical protein
MFAAARNGELMGLYLRLRQTLHRTTTCLVRKDGVILVIPLFVKIGNGKQSFSKYSGDLISLNGQGSSSCEF